MLQSLWKLKCLTSVGYSGCNQFVEQVVWDRGAVLVVAGHSPQRLLLPNPVLKHLRRHLHKVCLYQGSTEFWISGLIQTQTSSSSIVPSFKYKETADGVFTVAYLRAELVHNMTKLMEISLHFMVLEERGPTFSGLGKVSHHGRHWKPAFSIRSSAARLETKAGCVAILSFSGGREGRKCHTKGWI